MRYIGAKNVIIAILLFSLGFVYSYDFDRPENGNAPDLTFREDAFSGGAYLRMVYVGAPDCGASNNSTNHDHVRGIKEQLRRILSDRDIKFITTGVSNSLRSREGTQYLSETGPYDEIISGLSLYNSGVQRYAWEMGAGRIATPQILLIRTKYQPIGANPRGVIDVRRRDSVLIRKEGTGEIEKLYDEVTEGRQALSGLIGAIE